MKVRIKVNGKEVTQEELDARLPSKLDDMLAAGQPPGCKTDREFLEGHCNGNQFEKNSFLGDYYKGVAQKEGVDVKGKVYISGLAAFPGDPKAWVADRHDAKKVLDERGWGAEGMVEAKIQRVGEPTGGGVAPDIVEEKVQDALEVNPEANLEDVREQVTNQLKPHWVK